jgi:hypothetical protein
VSGLGPASSVTVREPAGHAQPPRGVLKFRRDFPVGEHGVSLRYVVLRIAAAKGLAHGFVRKNLLRAVNNEVAQKSGWPVKAVRSQAGLPQFHQDRVRFGSIFF